MKIGIDISPIKETNSLHALRGVGSYINLLSSYLEKFDRNNAYTFFTKGIKNKVDLIHYPYFDPFFLTLPLFNKTKSIVTIHDLIPILFPKNFPAGFRGRLKWLVQAYLAKKMSGIITDSMSSQKDITRILKIDPDKVHVVYLCADQIFKKTDNQILKNKIIKKYDLPKRFVLYVGDATWNKNLPRLVKAVKNLNLPFVMVGGALVRKNVDIVNSWNSDLVKVQKEIEANTNFIRLGFVLAEDLAVIYNLASLFVMPSLYEGFGLPVLEAMSCGCPVVTSKRGSLFEVGAEAAFYIEPESIESIAGGIKKVFSEDSLNLRLKEKSLERANDFSLKKTIEGTVRVYQKIGGQT